MTPDAVFDAGPLIYLDAIGYLGAVRQVHQIVIPESVAHELESRPGFPGSAVPALGGVKVRVPDETHVCRVEGGPPTLDVGERDAIALSLELEAMAVIDERRGRRRARSPGVPLTGAIGVLIVIHQTGLARRGFAEDPDALDTVGMYLTGELKRRVVERYRETSGGAS